MNLIFLKCLQIFPFIQRQIYNHYICSRMFIKTFTAIKNNISRLTLGLAIFYCSFLTFSLFSYQDEILPNLIESEFFIGDEDVDPSPARYLEIFRFHHSQVRSCCNNWSLVSLNSFLRYSSDKKNLEHFQDVDKLWHPEDFTILYSSFRI